jgi:2-methylfumaryl-CoA hydratase
MIRRFVFPKQKELAQTVSVDLKDVRAPQYGRYLEAFEPGQVFAHPRGYTFDRGAAIAFARTFMQANPLYLNADYARAHGFEDLLVSPQQVFNVVLSLGVQNDSEKAMANLGYYDAQFLAPVYPGDTLRAMTEVVERRERGEGKPGIVHIRTLGKNQHDEIVLQYERKIMVSPQGTRPAASPPVSGPVPAFPWKRETFVSLPVTDLQRPGYLSLTGPHTYFEDFKPGDIILHANGRTITDEHLALTYQSANTHPLHYDRIYSASLSGAMSGQPIVYGGLVFAWLEGLASRDVSENALWELGFTEGYHTQPSVAGDTVFAISRVLASDEAPGELNELAGVVTLQLIGLKDIQPAAAIEQYGAELFEKENDKKANGKEKIAAKIFEIERRLLIKRRPST